MKRRLYRLVRVAVHRGLCTLPLLALTVRAETGLVREYVQTNEIPQRVSETPLAVGANYETSVAPVFAGYIFTHWTMNVEGTTRDVWGRAYDAVPYRLESRIDFTAHYLPVDEDSDGDGVADGHEIYWYGNLAEGADSDTDGDGFTFAEELANGTNPLMAEGEEEGPIQIADGEMTLYNPNGYGRIVVRSEPEGAVTARDETYRPGTAVTTGALSPTTSTFAYWLRNGEPCRDAWGRAVDEVSFSLGEASEEFVAVCVADADERMKLYWYGTTEVAMDSDTDGDGRTFAEEIAAGTNPLMADADVEGPVQYGDGELTLYNPFDYKQAVMTTRNGSTVTTNSCEYLRPGTVVTTSAGSPSSSTFAYWTRNGEPCRDAWGRAIDQISFSMGTQVETLEAVQIANADDRQKLYWYGTTDVAMDSDTDGDGLTFAEEIAAGTNPLMADADIEGPVQVADGRLLLYDPLGKLDACIATVEGYEGAYDGQAHGITVKVLRPTSGYTLRYGLSDSGPFSATMPTFKDVGTHVIWYELASNDYENDVDCGTVTITKGTIPGGGEEPGAGEIPEGGLSKFDATYMYDGEGHTIKTNELVAAFAAACGGAVNVVYAVDDGTGESGGLIEAALPWGATAPAITNAGSIVVWYKVTNPNYNDFVHQAKVTVTKRAMSAVSVSDPGVIDYTGAAITPSVMVSDGSPSIVKSSDYAVSYADNVQPGTAKIILTATANGNYTGTKTVPFTIRKTTFDIDDGTGGEGGKSSKFSYLGVYDGRGHGINVKVENPPAGMVIKYSRGQPGKAPGGTWSTVKPLYTDVCDNVVWYAVECAGYVSFTNNATVTITPKPLTVMADAKDKTFGTADPALTYVASGLLVTDALKGALAREPGETVGTYDILQGTLAAGPNYALDYTGATFTISQTPIIGPFGPAEPDIDPETGLVVIRLLGDQGPIVIPDNLGPFILDLNGHSITGVCGSAESGNFDGGPALTIVHVEGGEGTGLIIRNSDPEGRGGIFGGDGADGTAEHPAGGNGGPGVLIEDAAVAPSVTIEENVLVRGGRGGDGYAGSGADGGNGSAGIEDQTTDPDDSTIINGGTIEGGDGGNGADGTGDTPGGNGGNGGAGVDGDVDDNTGTITGGNGGNGGDSESGNGGNGGDGGDGVSGDVGSNEGTITGGNGGDGGSSGSGDGGNGGNGGSGVGGDVGDNTGTITDGEDGTTVLTETMVSLAEGPWVYARAAIEPTVTVTSGGSALVKDVDFAVQYLNNVNVGQATVRITGIGTCEGTVTKTFVISPKPLTVTADAKTQVYGEEAKPLTYTTVGLCSGDALTGALTREPGEDVGEYDILQGTLANGNYAISYTGAKYTIMKGTIPGGGEEPGTGMIPEGGLSKFDRTGVYNGKGQTIDLEKLEEAFAPYTSGQESASPFRFAVSEDGPWSEVAPTITDIGELVMWYKVTSPNYEDYVHQAKVTVVEKVITDEMVQPGEDAFFFDGDDKKPTVDVQYFVDGKDICKENDYTLTYGTKAGAGWWVTVTGKGNYSGTVTKIVPVLKRPVAPPVVPSRSYNGRMQKPTIPTDSRWTVVANPGGINVGEYPNVVLRLTNTTDYKWKGGAEDQTDITLVFKVTKANNGWSRQPGMKGWAYGETPSEPAMGQARYGTVRVAYRKAGADVSTETATRPELPGKYVARFWVDETENFIGVAVHEPYKDIAFEITGSAPGGTETTTTPVPVPHDWLEAYVAEFGGGDYETAANAKGKNGVSLWESYVAGLDPTDATSQFTAIITMGADGKPVITWEPDLCDANPPRVYVEYGKTNLGDTDWTPVTDANRAAMRFFKVGVEIK